jgi:hypothetical protein
MRTLSAAELPDVWERGERQHPLDRALTLLAAACPEKERQELMHLSIGQRDALLLTLRQLTFGPQLEAYAECPACGAQLEFNVNIEELLRDYRSVDISKQSTKLNDFSINFRLPDSTDLAACINASSLEADRELLQRCILKITRKKKEVALNDIPAATLSALVARMAELDPLADIQIALDCTECNHRWEMLLDILAFFWAELGIQTKQLLYQVHVLARAYGWHEADILVMSPWRRQYYLDMVI